MEKATRWELYLGVKTHPFAFSFTPLPNLSLGRILSYAWGFISILTFQKGRFFAPLGGWSQFWLCIATIEFYSQVALLLLAIRRRFKQ